MAQILRNLVIFVGRKQGFIQHSSQIQMFTERQIKIFWSNLTGSGWWWPVRGRSFCPGQNPSNWDSQWRCCCCSNSDQNSDNKYNVEYMTNTFSDYIANTFSAIWLIIIRFNILKYKLCPIRTVMSTIQVNLIMRNLWKSVASDARQGVDAIFLHSEGSPTVPL